jgi:hypothetical protein
MKFKRWKRKNETKLMGKKNPTIQSILQRLGEDAARPGEIDLWPAIQARAQANQARSPVRGRALSKRFTLLAFAAAIALLAVIFFLARNATPVSAQQIIARAAAAQSQAATSLSHGVAYTRKEIISYPRALAGDLTASRSIHETYYDYQLGKIRWDFYDADTKKVSDAFSFDGNYTLDADQSDQRYVGGLLTVYRSQENEDGLVSVLAGGGDTTAQQIFDLQRNAPNVVVTSDETWPDGREVYVLGVGSPRDKLTEPQPSSNQPGGVEYNHKTYEVFDAKTYQLIETRDVIVQNGKEILVAMTRTLIEQVIPAGNPVPWDMNDLPGIRVVDKVEPAVTATPHP